MNTPTQKRQPRKIFRSAFFLTTLLLLIVVAINRQSIHDWWRLRNYTPPATISALASETTMTDFARKIFYVNRPELTSDDKFAKACSSSVQEQTIVLGCYHSNQAGIYLLDVRDQRLGGVEQVTAAHEMLHAAYDRLTTAERKQVDSLLENYYQTELTNPRIKETIDAYRKSEPNDLPNEMHSIFGSEIADLPEALETYYKKYFDNRQQVVAFADRYQAEFISRETAIKQDDARLATMRIQIDDLKADVSQKQNAISIERRQMIHLRESDVESYNARVSRFNNMIDNYNYQITRLRSLIASYNQLVAERNAVAIEENQLVDALSNNFQTIQD